MSQFNQSTPQNNAGKKNNTIIYWVLILVLFVLCIYLFMSKRNMQADNAQAMKMEQQQMDSVKTDRASLQNDFDAASAKIDQLVSQNSKLDSALQGDKAAMAKMQGEIRSILANKNATKAELQKARDMISGLTDKTKAYEARIAELEKENTTLTGENKNLTHERDSTVTQNVALKKVGSVLHASNIRMEPIHKKRNGKEKETSKAKRVDEFRIKFDIDENRIAESGTKQIYLRIISPDGNIMTNSANGSGMLTTSKGGQLSYSIESDIALTQNQPVKDITVDWNQSGDYNKGTYTIEIYNEGYLVGSGTVTLK
jgi:peptidoglycan hydrolase CwlO-like protein